MRVGKGRGARLGVVGVVCYTGLYLAGILGFQGSMVVEALLGLSALKFEQFRSQFRSSYLSTRYFICELRCYVYQHLGSCSMTLTFDK